MSCSHDLMISSSHYHLLSLLPLSSSQHRISFICLPFLLLVGGWPCGRLHGCTSHSIAKSWRKRKIHVLHGNMFDGKQLHGTCIETLAILIINIISLSITLNYIGLQFWGYDSEAPKELLGNNVALFVTSKRHFKRRIWKGTLVSRDTVSLKWCCIIFFEKMNKSSTEICSPKYPKNSFLSLFPW